MSRSLLELGTPQALAVAVDRAIISEQPTGLPRDEAEYEAAAADGWVRAKKLLAGTYHRPSPGHLTAYWNEARWRSENIGNEDAFRETIRALLMAEPLPWSELVGRARPVSASTARQLSARLAP